MLLSRKPQGCDVELPQHFQIDVRRADGRRAERATMRRTQRLTLGAAQKDGHARKQAVPHV
jgi:hypothetical protein